MNIDNIISFAKNRTKKKDEIISTSFILKNKTHEMLGNTSNYTKYFLNMNFLWHLTHLEF